MIRSYPSRTAAAFHCGVAGLALFGNAQTSFAQKVTTIAAIDSSVVRLEGNRSVRIYPRSVGENVLWLIGRATSATVTGAGRAIYLMLPPAFTSPGPYYGNLGGSTFRYRVDDRPWTTLQVMTSARDVALAEDLSPGRHTIRVEPIEGPAGLGSFVYAAAPLTRIGGTITPDEFADLMTDVRADVFRGDSLVRSSYTRNPVNGKWSILGLDPGTYRIRFTAHGWQPREITAVISRPGEKVDLGDVVLHVDFAPQAKSWQTYIGFGRTESIAPGESLTWELPDATNLKEAYLVGRYKTIRLEQMRAESDPTRRKGSGAAGNLRLGYVTLRMPASTPHDMYGLRLVFTTATATRSTEVPQAIAVREPLPLAYHLAGVGHMNTWGQQPSEYLARVAATAQLAGARHLLVANEVNALYVAGALKDLRIPYLTTNGNHTVGRWSEFFGPRTFAVDDGALRLVAFNERADMSWRDVEALLVERESATSRVVVAYEGYAPIDVIRRSGVDLLYDGHSTDPHASLKDFPPRTLQMRAPTQETMRWIAMDHQGLASSIKTASDVPYFEIPRTGPSPLRAEYSNPNDGTGTAVTARVINDTDLRFESARLRFVLRAGTVSVAGGRVLQRFVSDDGKLTVLDVELVVPPRSTTAVQASSR